MAGKKTAARKKTAASRGKPKPAVKAPRANGAAREDDAPSLHLIKLCVGVSEIAELAEWQKKRRRQFKRRYNTHVTRNVPRRAEELLAGGSLYWVIAGKVRVRQRLIGIVARQDKDGEPCCELRLDRKLIETSPRPHRPFQGWRYLESKDAPPDIATTRGRGDKLPPALVEELRELGLL